jgi:hypothetical protein
MPRDPFKLPQLFVNYPLGRLDPMLMRNTICSLILAAFVAALGYGLRQLATSMEFSSFMIFCVAAFAAMVIAAFSWDRYERNRSRRLPPPAR